jgi:NAD-dependent deacetylase
VGSARLDRAPQLKELAEARALLERAESIVVLTGAGVSAESGVPTFRGQGGLWKSRRPEEIATPEAFARDPRLVWEWYAWRRSVVGRCAPNAAHLALARLALGRGAIERTSARIVTQNVDGLHHRAADLTAAGADPMPAYPIEVHGAIHRDRCSACARRTPPLPNIDTTSVDRLPHCERCGGLLRPDVVWFGEALDADLLTSAIDAAARADVCLVVGTSAVVYPAAGLPEATLAQGGSMIEVNPDTTPLTSRATVSLRGKATELLPDLF